MVIVAGNDVVLVGVLLFFDGVIEDEYPILCFNFSNDWFDQLPEIFVGVLPRVMASSRAADIPVTVVNEKELMR